MNTGVSLHLIFVRNCHGFATFGTYDSLYFFAVPLDLSAGYLSSLAISLPGIIPLTLKLYFSARKKQKENIPANSSFNFSILTSSGFFHENNSNSSLASMLIAKGRPFALWNCFQSLLSLNSISLFVISSYSFIVITFMARGCLITISIQWPLLKWFCLYLKESYLFSMKAIARNLEQIFFWNYWTDW